MATPDFVASDAFGDFVFLGVAPPVVQPNVKPPCQSTFLFPIRSKANPALPGKGQGEAVSHVQSADAAADVTATVLVKLTGTASINRGCKAEAVIDDVAVGGSSRCGAKCDKTDCGHGHPTTPDTINPQLGRDQCSSSPAVGPSANCPAGSPASLSRNTSMDRRSGDCSRSGSGGGAPPHGAQNIWHNTEWWRSFSSSRLNEMATEEPDKRSPEMRKVPYVGGAEPMCTLVHGTD